MKFTLTKSLTIAMLLLSMQAGAQSANSYESYQAPKKSITVGTLSMLSGYLPVYYERYQNQSMSWQFGVGITYRSVLNDLANSFMNDGKHSGSFYSNDISDFYDQYSHRKALPGVMFEIAPKFYPRKRCMNGFYLGPKLAYKFYFYKAEKIDNQGKYTGDYQNEYRNCFDLTFNIGHHYQSGRTITTDWYLGIGFRYQYSLRQDLGKSGGLYINGERGIDKAYPIVTFNASLGK